MLEAFLALLNALEARKLNYCVIEGIAVLIYGGRASTLDLDVYLVSKNRKQLLQLCKQLGAKLTARGEDQYQGSYRGFKFDVLIADPWVGLPAIKRAKRIAFAGKHLRIATPEDIVIMKTIADRPVDRRDVQELREIFSGKLDETYIRKKTASIAKAIGKGLDDG